MGDRGFELTHSFSSAPSWREHALSTLLAIGGGWSWSLCFEAEERGWLAWVALAPLLMLLERRNGVRWALLFGVVYWSAALPWIVTTLASFGGMPVSVARLIFVVLVCYLAIDIVLFAWIGRFLLRASPEWGWLGLPGDSAFAFDGRLFEIKWQSALERPCRPCHSRSPRLGLFCRIAGGMAGCLDGQRCDASRRCGGFGAGWRRWDLGLQPWRAAI